MHLIDLTHPVENAMPVYPGDPEALIVPALTAASDGVNVQRLHLGTHTGTHVDAPFHVNDAWPRLHELPLTRFTGPAVILDARDLPPRAPIPPDAVPAGLREGDVLLVMTGWSVHWNTDTYLAHPYLPEETAAAIVATGVRTVAIDALSVDRTPAPDETSFTLAAHRTLCGAGAVIAENLTALHEVHEARTAGHQVETSLFPLALTADGAPIRAIARVG
nr:cyclase family protein [Actinomadura flavalba]